MSNLLPEYEQDVKDSHESMLRAKQELKQAEKWYIESIIQWGDDLERLQNYKKENGL